MKQVNSIVLLPVGIFSFLAGAVLGRSRRNLSMLKPERGSPLPGVPLARWERFITIMAVAPKRHVTPRGRMGAFALDARRLADVGFMERPRKATVGSEAGVWTGDWKPPLTAEKFLDSTKAQYEAFSRSMRRMAPKVAGLVGCDIDGRKATLSGLLGVGHLAGESGVEGWASDPAIRKKFSGTTERFRKTNEIF